MLDFADPSDDISLVVIKRTPWSASLDSAVSKG